MIIFSACVSPAAAEKNGGLVGLQRDGDFISQKIPHGLKSAYVPGEVLVRFKPSAKGATIQSIHSRLKSTVLAGRGGKIERVRIEEGLTVKQAVDAYLEDHAVGYAQPNFIYHTNSIPNDSSFDQLWGLHNTGQVVNGTEGTRDADIDAPEAWDIATGATATIVAVIDTGVDLTHPDLAANIWRNPGETSCSDGVDDDGNGYVDDCLGWDFWANDNDPSDYNGHGTEVAGIIGAVGNNSRGLAGVNWDARIMALRAGGVSGSLNTFAIIQAIDYAISKNARVINCSWGNYDYDGLLYEAFRAGESAGVLFVTVAGNGGANVDVTPYNPASYDLPNIIAVAATDQNDNLASFSNFGPISVDVAAPGVNIYGTIPSFGYGAPAVVYSTNFDSDTAGSLPVGWSSGGTPNTWMVNNASAYSLPNSLEDSPEGDYLNNTVSMVSYATPIIPVKDHRYTLNFRVRADLEPFIDFLYLIAYQDQLNFLPEFRTGSTLDSFVSDSADYTYGADLFTKFYLGFGLYAGSIITYDGVYLDDISLTMEPIFILSHTYGYNDGTSFACSYVTGLAALIWSQRIGLTATQVKDLIVSNVDVLDSLRLEGGDYLVSSEGRINAYKALDGVLATLLPTPSGQEYFEYSPTGLPLKDCEPSLARPVGVGPVAEGGDTLSLRISPSQCSGPVDVYFGVYAPSVAPDHVFILRPDCTLRPLSEGLVPWKANLTVDLDEILSGDVPTADLLPSIYYVYFVVTPAGRTDSCYFWQTSFVIP